MAIQQSFERYLGKAARAVIRRERLFVVAVTGSIGKSTAKQAIGAVLRSDLPEHRVRVTSKNYNNELGVPLTVFGKPAPGRNPLAWISLLCTAFAARIGFWRSGLRTLVLEMGADKPGDIAYLTSVAAPDVAVVTAIASEDSTATPVHAANYPNIEALVEEKSQLVRALKTGGTAVLNADDARVFGMRHLTHEHVLTFGEADGSDVRIAKTSVRMEETPDGRKPTGLEILLECYQRTYELFIPGVYGRSIAYAVASGVAVGQAMDILEEQVTAMASAFTPMPGRTRIIEGIKRTTLFDDSYNASPSSTLSSLRDLAALQLAPGQRRAACIGEMRELGDTAQAMHRMVGAEAARLGLDLLVVCGIFAHAMAEGALANGMNPEAVKVIEDTPEAGLFLQDWIKPGDVVLAKASEGTQKTKGVRMERVIKELMADPMRAEQLLVRQGAVWQRK
jgi:UDP-N-acetylmuramoyl-tripeptide--D-alanyl-D-alanine ligase